MSEQTFTEMIEKLRENGYTDSHLAKLCGCSRQAIWQIRKGRVVTPHYHTARKLIALTEALH